MRLSTTAACFIALAAMFALEPASCAVGHEAEALGTGEAQARRWLSFSTTEVGEGEVASDQEATQDLATSQVLKAGMVVELRHSSGKGCGASDTGPIICNLSKGSVFRVVDGGSGYIGLVEGEAPFEGELLPPGSLSPTCQGMISHGSFLTQAPRLETKR